MTTWVQIRVISPEYEPLHGSAGATGFDLKCRLGQALEILPGESARVPTGVFIASTGLQLEIRSRSSAFARCLLVDGTIDEDYRGELMINIINAGKHAQLIRPLERVAQLIFTPKVDVRLRKVSELDSTERGAAGFGSTGTQEPKK